MVVHQYYQKLIYMGQRSDIVDNVREFNATEGNYFTLFHCEFEYNVEV